MGLKKYTAVVNKEEDMFVAECPEVGTVSQGYSLDEAIKNLKEATELLFRRISGKGKTEVDNLGFLCSETNKGVTKDS